ncbi:MAG: alginate export family protein [Candidatus Omnitrophica bacterium]|nr:alginate export family protein [Candidatus Omnitrophota bacterium]
MRSILKILIAVFAVCLIAPAFSAVENVKVGGDIAVWGILRGDWVVGREGFYGDYGDGVNLHTFVTQARVYVSADLSENVSTMIRLINERAWGSFGNELPDSYTRSLPLMLDLAYIKIKDALTPGLSFTIGRQEIEFGEGLVLGNRYWSIFYPGNISLPLFPVQDLGLQKAFDGIRLDYAPEAFPVNLTLFYSKINDQFSNSFNDAYEANLYAANIGFKLAEVANIDLYYVGLGALPEYWNPNLDGYYGIIPDTGLLSTAGIRIVSGIPGVPGLTLKAEYARQFGNSGTDNDINFKGWALLAGIKYESQINMKPWIKLNYARYSADDDATSDALENWIPVFPSNTASRIGPILFAYDAALTRYTNGAYPYGVGIGNAQAFNLGFGITPAEKWSLAVDGYWVKSLVGDNNYGYEVDATIEYKFTEDLTFGVTGGSIFGGNVFGGNLGRPWQVLGYAKVAF